MKRNRTQFEAGSGSSLTSPSQGRAAQASGPAQVPASDDDSRQAGGGGGGGGGDGGHVPKISRRIRACTECKKHKIRCDMSPGELTCQRCQRMNLECVVNKSLQTLLDDETEYGRAFFYLCIKCHVQFEFDG